ncbi:hypothetical protein DA100_04010 [Vibrio sp. Hep-1b-8]|nr:hypothetical protein DA100_04010 [Vibrio sp. Hep-1b-8]
MLDIMRRQMKTLDVKSVFPKLSEHMCCRQTFFGYRCKLKSAWLIDNVLLEGEFNAIKRASNY